MSINRAMIHKSSSARPAPQLHSLHRLFLMLIAPRLCRGGCVRSVDDSWPAKSWRRVFGFAWLHAVA